ncbi:hypothetical protein AVEN_97552-1 [Araneus ventricosus]|uniref:Uncharacterized protein n=1 Tax=Araneus ventricosus TaxID=182803 RepID=A0A4Y2J9K5_ARAVE|nr:hypothetical protein AVEN_97552-1 [Araneus ventricosus]
MAKNGFCAKKTQPNPPFIFEYPLLPCPTHPSENSLWLVREKARPRGPRNQGVDCSALWGIEGFPWSVVEVLGLSVAAAPS